LRHTRHGFHVGDGRCGKRFTGFTQTLAANRSVAQKEILMLVHLSSPTGWTEAMDIPDEIAIARLNGGTAKLIDCGEERRELAVIQRVVHRAAKFVTPNRYAGLIRAKVKDGVYGADDTKPRMKTPNVKPHEGTGDPENPWKKLLNSFLK
jgi:hypothetical protein